jgi:hypothetical protein
MYACMYVWMLWMYENRYVCVSMCLYVCMHVEHTVFDVEHTVFHVEHYAGTYTCNIRITHIRMHAYMIER